MIVYRVWFLIEEWGIATLSKTQYTCRHGWVTHYDKHFRIAAETKENVRSSGNDFVLHLLWIQNAKTENGYDSMQSRWQMQWFPCVKHHLIGCHVQWQRRVWRKAIENLGLLRRAWSGDYLLSVYLATEDSYSSS